MKKMFWTLAVAMTGLAYLQSASAAVVTSGTITVTEILAYTDTGGGDVIFRVSSATSGCTGGFWLRPSDAGFKNAYAAVLVAHATGNPVTVSAYNDSIWSGSGSNYCRVQNIHPI